VSKGEGETCRRRRLRPVFFSVCLAVKPVGELDAGNLPVRLCVQRRLACSAGDKPAGAKVRRPVVWIAGWRATKTLKPIDKVSLGEITSHRAVTKVNAQVASKMSGPRVEPATEGRRQHGMPKSDRRGISISAGWKRQHGGKDMPSNWRSPPRPGEKSPEQGRSYNRHNRESDRRREGGGWVRSSDEAE
jgi:hypothetical protein